MLFLQAIFLSLYLNFMQIHPLLQPYHWENRILLIFSPSDDFPAYLEQNQIFEDNQPAIKERDLVIFKVMNQKGMAPGSKALSQQEVKSLREHLGIEEKFVTVLIGKDGTVKRKYEKVVKMETINAIIDAMPMRQREMRSKQ